MCEFNDHWVEMAMADDALVANVLLSFNRPASRILNVRWTIHQRRSPRKKHKSAARDSPTTPLSWSAATSAASPFDGSDDSSRLAKPLDNARSTAEDQSETATAKRLRKKRTLPELFEKEKMLLEESRDLKNKLASLHLTVDKHRARNLSLKRMKIDFVSRQSTKIAATSLVSEKAVLDNPPQLVESHQSELVLPQADRDKALNEELLVEAHQAESLSPQIVEAKVLIDESLVDGHQSEVDSRQTEKDRVSNDESPASKRMKVGLVSRQSSGIAATSLVSEKAALDPPQLVEAHQPELASPQTEQDKVANALSLVSAANASSEQLEIGDREPLFLLPDLNEPLGEDFDSNDVPNVS